MQSVGIKMILLVYMIFAAMVLQIDNASSKSCDRINIGNRFYDKQVLWSEFGRPYNLIVHKASNMLFFSFSKPETYSDLDFQLVQLNVDTKEYQSIAGIKGGCATAIDQANDEIYLGGSDGIYKYNMATKIADLYSESDKNIWSLFYRCNLFYVSYPDQRLFMEVDGKFAIVLEFQDFEVDQFFNTIDGRIYFANNTGLYKFTKNNMKTELIYDLITVRQITEDNTGKLYACTNIGLFVIRDSGLEKVLTMKNIHGLAFDRDNNFILSDDKRVMKLLESNMSCLKDNRW